MQKRLRLVPRPLRAFALRARHLRRFFFRCRLVRCVPRRIDSASHALPRLLCYLSLLRWKRSHLCFADKKCPHPNAFPLRVRWLSRAKPDEVSLLPSYFLPVNPPASQSLRGAPRKEFQSFFAAACTAQKTPLTERACEEWVRKRSAILSPKKSEDFFGNYPFHPAVKASWAAPSLPAETREPVDLRAFSAAFSSRARFAFRLSFSAFAAASAWQA